jgi:hypothetical protein
MDNLQQQTMEKDPENDEAASELNFKIRKYGNARLVAFVR